MSKSVNVSALLIVVDQFPSEHETGLWITGRKYRPYCFRDLFDPSRDFLPDFISLIKCFMVSNLTDLFLDLLVAVFALHAGTDSVENLILQILFSGQIIKKSFLVFNRYRCLTDAVHQLMHH